MIQLQRSAVDQLLSNRSACLAGALIALSMLLGLPAFAQDEALADDVPNTAETTVETKETPAESEQEATSGDAKEWSDTFNQMLDASLGRVNKFLFDVLFFDVSFDAFDYEVTDEATGEKKLVEPAVPFLVIFLTLGAVFFTIWHKLINVRHFFHAWKIVLGKYSDDTDEGDLSPFRALTSALSAFLALRSRTTSPCCLILASISAAVPISLL